MAKPKFSIGLPVLVKISIGLPVLVREKRVKGEIIDSTQYPDGWCYTVFLEKPVEGTHFLEIKEKDIIPLKRRLRV